MEEKDLARALRRHHAARIKKARQHYWGRTSQGLRCGLTALDARQLGMLLNTRALCSSMCCGNQRRWFGDSLHELREKQESVFDSLDAEREQD